KLSTYRVHRSRIDESTKHSFFLFSFGVFIFLLGDNAYVLSHYNFRYDTRGMPELFSHKIFPRQFWPQSDWIVFSIVACCMVVYYNLWRGKWLDSRYCMYLIKESGSDQLIVNGKGLFPLVEIA